MADLGLIGGLVGGASNVIGGIAGSNAGAGLRNQAQSAVDAAYQQLASMGLPPDEAKTIVYNQFKQAGTLTPQLEQQINQGPSQMAGVTGSAPAQQAQLQALQILQQRGQTGLTPEDRAALNQIRQQVAADTNAKQQAIQQQFAARGQGGSGAELIGALQASQSGANQESTAGDQLAAMASQNALQAIGQSGTLGGQIQQQQFGEQAQKAQAQDVINQFNAQNQVNQQARNVGAQNQAQAANLGAAQNVSNANTQQSNQELLRQNQAQRQQYLDTLNRANTINAGAQGYAANLEGMANQRSAAAAAPYEAIGSLFGSTGQYLNNAQNKPQAQSAPNYSDQTANNNQSGGGFSNSQWAMYNGGKVPAYNEGGDVTSYNGNQVTDYRDGGHVPGKAKMPGDHPANDTVPAMLSPGEMVIPRSLAKTTFGKKLAKLLEQHHEVMEHAKNGGQ